MRDYVERFLGEVPGKRIQTKALEASLTNALGIQGYWQRGGYPALAEVISGLVQANRLKPIKAQKTNGMNPPLYNGYHILKLPPSFSPEKQRKLLARYHPRLDLAYYLKHPEEYERDEYYLQALDGFLRTSEKDPAGQEKRSITINERSFELFYDEKWLASNHGQTVLQAVGLSLTDLNCHPTYEPFFYYQVRAFTDHDKRANIMIVENKDTFFSLKSLFQAGIMSWDGINYDLLIYGEGRKILRSLSFLGELFLEGSVPPNVLCHYFGDLDPEGILIWNELVQSYQPQGLTIVPLRLFYEELLNRHGLNAPTLRTAQRYRDDAILHFVSEFEQPLRDKLQALLQGGCYLPQEGLSEASLYELGREGKNPGLD